jgi:hypothetical protein
MSDDTYRILRLDIQNYLGIKAASTTYGRGSRGPDAVVIEDGEVKD